MTTDDKFSPQLVARLERQNLGRAGDVLASAFQVDPMYCFVVPNAADRRRWLPVIKRALLANVEPLGHCYVAQTVGGKIAGVLALTPPGHYPHSRWAELRLAINAIMRPTPWCPNLRKLWRIRRYAQAFLEMHYHLPHWYIDVIGVEPSQQRRGAGRLLMSKVIELSTSSGAPIWLETQTEANVPYYQSLGFDVTVRRHPAKDGPPTWGMLRPV
jgi:ribosomal protein S18 acetylase RimI-like enzyme